MNIKKFREIILNAAQLAVVVAVEISKKKKIFLEWARGAGKSFILAYFMLKMVKQMPGAAFGLVGSTYQQILSRTLPSTKEGLAMFGIYEGYDYVIGKSGKKLGFKEPIQPPNKWDNIIHFSNGSIFQLIALDSPNTGRGLNIYAFINDEAALSDPVKLFTNVKTTNRAIKARFKNASLLGAEIYASSTPLAKKGKWFTDIEKVAKKNPKDYAYIKASAYVNIDNLRKGWFKEMKDESPSDVVYEAEILNIRPKEILNGFYPSITSKNYYSDFKNDYLEGLINGYDKSNFNCRQDNDLVLDVPLILSIDWGVFLSAVVSQNLQTIKEYRTLKEFWVKSPSDIEDLLNDFCDYYEPKSKKIVHLYYGHDGNKKISRGVYSGKTYGNEAVKLLEKRNWIVIDKSEGKPAALHNDKYLLTNVLGKETRSSYPCLRINESNCPDLLISIERAEAKEGRNGIEKVKKDESNISMKQQHTTHLSDAYDIPIYDLFSYLLEEQREHLDLPLTT